MEDGFFYNGLNVTGIVYGTSFSSTSDARLKKIIKIGFLKNANLFEKFAITTNCNNIQKALNKSKIIILR